MKIDKNNCIPVKFKPQIRNFAQVTNELRKLKDNFQEERGLFLEAGKRLKENMELLNKPLKRT